VAKNPKPDLVAVAAEVVDDLFEQFSGSHLWQPLDGPQVAALESEADELFFGGAAGGGKSWLLLGAASTQHRRSIIFRRELTQLRQLIDDSRDVLDGSTARYNGSDYVWRDIPGQRMLEWGGSEYPKDVRKYQGRAHDLKGFDEITHFTLDMYLYLSGWLRTPIPGQRTRIICTGNPPSDVEGEWVIEYWGPWLNPEHPNPAEPGELRWFTRIDGVDTEVDGAEPFELEIERGGQTIVETIYPRSRTFIPARIDDNPIYLATGYKSVLQSLGEPLRSQLLYGDFGIGLDDDQWQVIPTEWVRLAQKRWEDIHTLCEALGTERPDVAQRALGVDVAYGGQDQTVIAPLYGNYVDRLIKYPGTATPDGPTTAKYVLDAHEPGAKIYIDGVGYGASAYDQLKAVKGVTVISVNNGSKSTMRDKSGMFEFVNLRSETFWKFREMLDPESGENIALPPDRELRVDLCTPRYKLQGGKYAVESKEDIKKRIGRSTDCGDAVLLAFRDQFRTKIISRLV